MTKSNLKVVDPPRSVEREALAQALADHQAAEANLRKISQTREHADEVAIRAHATLEASQKKLAEAKATEGQRMAAAALGEPTTLLSAVDAQATVEQARNDLEVARSTRDAL